MKFSVLMSVYAKETPAFLEEAMASIIGQRIKPDEIVIVEDGPLPLHLHETLDRIEHQTKTISIKRYPLESNVGLGRALRYGVEKCSNEWIARMDSDDICAPSRFLQQIAYIKDNPSIDVVGSNVSEFIGSPENVVAYKVTPEHHDAIVSFSKRRNPFNHPSVIMRKSSVLSVGNYRHYPMCEDYDLWTRLISKGMRCHNIQENLVIMRTSHDFYKRRGGIKYLRSILRLKRELLQRGFCSRTDFLVSSCGSIVVCVMPSGLRGRIYSKLLRKAS